VIAATLVQRAPYSTGRLRAILDETAPVDLKLKVELTLGHSWCRPTCPIVTRVYKAADLGPPILVLSISNALARQHVIPNTADLRAGSDGAAQYRSPRLGIIVKTKRVPPVTNSKGEVVRPGEQQLLLTLASHRT
jgi:hypothetical protein